MTIMDLRALSTVTDYFVVCTAQSSPQMTAVREQIERVFSRRRWPVWHTEGSAASNGRGLAVPEPQWVLMDCGEVIVHLLDPAARTLYRLEDLWADAPRLSVPPAAAEADAPRARAR
ncbi:MAG: ribosome silencing factor [Candidatus Omnitrophica bacterium]|nr:ribosome silencing factor [Candidatus Omnitrophota bacterium]